MVENVNEAKYNSCLIQMEEHCLSVIVKLDWFILQE